MSELWQMSFAYRLAKQNGEFILQALWVHTFTREEEWRDIPTVELPPNKACSGQEPAGASESQNVSGSCR